jgi:hypothetical protein
MTHAACATEACIVHIWIINWQDMDVAENGYLNTIYWHA